MNLVERAKKLIVSPATEWQVIKGETHTVAGLYTQYVMILAAIPAVAAFIGWSVVGYSGMGTTYRIPMGAGVANMVLSYILSLGSVYVIALVIDALAPSFGGEKNFMQALKVAAFFPTAAWLAGVFYILPLLAILALAGALYSLWLLYVGLAPLMAVPEQKAMGYTAVVILVAIVLMVVISTVAALAMPSTSRGF
jgi:Yip1 domain